MSPFEWPHGFAESHSYGIGRVGGCRLEDHSPVQGSAAGNVDPRADAHTTNEALALASAQLHLLISDLANTVA